MEKKEFKLLVLPSVPNMQQVVEKFPFPIALTKGQYKRLEITFLDGKVTALYNNVDLQNFSFVWLCSSWKTRDLAYALQFYLNKEGIPNTPVEKGTSKLTDHMIFALNDIPTPDTMYVSIANVEESYARIQKTCGYPLVIKDTKGSQGMHSVKVETKKDLLEKLQSLPKHNKYLFQEYIPNEYDWGVMVANGVVVSGEKSYPRAGEFRNNACNGAREVFVDVQEIPKDIKDMALKASKALGLSWSRADIIIDKKTQKPYVLEVNRLPGITAKSSEVEGAYTFLSTEMAHVLG
jgi:glutathione synthase/RimK-type ligase-like ATP-grasp enzyme